MRDHEYADDTQCYLEFNLGDPGDQVRAASELVSCVSDAGGWLRKNLLKTNLDELICTYLYSSRWSLKPESLPLVLSNTKIETSRSARNLGTFIDEHLSMTLHVSDATRKVSFLL